MSVHSAMYSMYLESLLKQRQLGNDVGDGVRQRFVRRILGRRLDANDELVLERMRILVAGKQDIGVLEQLAGRAD